MANGFYEHGAKHWARGNFKWLFDATPTSAEDDAFRVALVDTADYTVNLATHEFRDAAGLAAGIEETSGLMTLVDGALDGIIDASDVVLLTTAGDQCEGILVYQDEGSAAADRLFLWWDTGVGGMPVTLGGDVTIAWSNGADKIAKL